MYVDDSPTEGIGDHLNHRQIRDANSIHTEMTYSINLRASDGEYIYSHPYSCPVRAIPTGPSAVNRRWKYLLSFSSFTEVE